MKKSKRIFIIAEAGVNHNGSLRTAKKLVDVAVDAGVDAVKFQTFKARDLVAKYAPCANYQKRRGGGKSQYELIKSLELDEHAHKELISYCTRKGVIFISSPFDMASIELLFGIGLRIFKIPSGEITNRPYLSRIGSLKGSVILSTGMSSLKEIKDALNVIVAAGTKREDLTVLHCVSEYPTPFERANLRAMLTIRDAFKVDIGYSDHTVGIEACVAAAALGASVIEKHFTLDRDMDGPDHFMSLEPRELASLVESVRNIERALGSGVKSPSQQELENRLAVRKSVVASRPIKKGEVFTEANITVKRSSIGISPMKWNAVIGKRAKKHFLIDELVRI